MLSSEDNIIIIIIIIIIIVIIIIIIIFIIIIFIIFKYLYRILQSVVQYVKNIYTDFKSSHVISRYSIAQFNCDKQSREKINRMPSEYLRNTGDDAY